MSTPSITELEPRLFWKYFSEITNIPRCSQNLDAIRAYIQNFANEQKLDWKEDAAGNILVYKAGSSASKEPILLQAHLDMVCEAVPGSGKDMLFEPPIPIVSGDWVRAKDSSLGGDDGMGVALILSVLHSSFSHPPIEALFTVDEEIGLVGAQKLDARLISARRMINIDSEEEGIFTVAAAGGNKTSGNIPIAYEEYTDSKTGDQAYKIIIEGLKGGHSGVKIHEGRANSAVLFARLFHFLSANGDVRLASLRCGGIRSNVIPSYAEMVIVSSDATPALVEDFTTVIRHEFAELEPELQIKIQKTSSPKKVLKPASLHRIVALIDLLPCGVQAFSKHFAGVVESSVNIAFVSLEAEVCTVLTSQRSLFEHALDYYTEKVETAFKVFGGNTLTDERYATWPPQEKDELVRHLMGVYKELFADRSPTSAVIHAGLECGEVLKKIPGIEVVSIGADMEDVHSVRERICISSLARMWTFLQAALERL